MATAMKRTALLSRAEIERIAQEARAAGMTQAQLAMAAARIPNPVPNNALDRDLLSTTTLGAIFGVDRTTITSARFVLEKATPAEIRLIDAGEIGCGTLARKIRAGVSPADRAAGRAHPQAARKDSPRVEGHRLAAKIYRDLRNAIELLSGMPRAADVLSVVRRIERAGTVNDKLDTAVTWLMEFSDEWTNASRR